MPLTDLLTWMATLHAIVALLAVPLAWGWVPTNDLYGYRMGDYRSWPAEK